MTILKTGLLPRKSKGLITASSHSSSSSSNGSLTLYIVAVFETDVTPSNKAINGPSEVGVDKYCWILSDAVRWFENNGDLIENECNKGLAFSKRSTNDGTEVF
ncbi:hypothetical protein WICPIJ_004905 [Wickerhamomyces pijperi]|uniref:Uncharacterized protein n=1 Tax=Wickerhamomyces pijperi TaxID=599730 RepID=A0A9P8TMF6_WICPI|nr:hypothetical protein WICPIJ_004905 [Wickerhamomyces pijperi]